MGAGAAVLAKGLSPAAAAAAAVAAAAGTIISSGVMGHGLLIFCAGIKLYLALFAALCLHEIQGKQLHEVTPGVQAPIPLEACFNQ